MSFLMEPNMLHPLTLHLNPQHQQQNQRSSLPPIVNNSNLNHGYPPFYSNHNNNNGNNNGNNQVDDEDEDDDDLVDVDDEDDDQDSIEESTASKPHIIEKPRPSILTHNRPANPPPPTRLPETATNNNRGKHDTSFESTITEHEERSTSGISTAENTHLTPSEVDLLKENRELRKKMERLMKDNMKLMQGIKDRDHKAYKQKLRLSKYRKALLRFFEQEAPSEGSSSGGEDDLSDTSTDDRKANHTPIKKEKHHNHFQSPSPDSVMASTSPPTVIDFEYDDVSPDSINHKRRKVEGDLDIVPDRKRKSGTRRNALWSVEDDEKFTQAYTTYGKSWKSIHECLPDKTREQVQSHGQYLIRIGKLEDVKGNTKRGRKGSKHHPKSGQPLSPQGYSPSQFIAQQQQLQQQQLQQQQQKQHHQHHSHHSQHLHQHHQQQSSQQQHQQHQAQQLPQQLPLPSFLSQ